MTVQFASLRYTVHPLYTAHWMNYRKAETHVTFNDPTRLSLKKPGCLRVNVMFVASNVNTGQFLERNLVYRFLWIIASLWTFKFSGHLYNCHVGIWFVGMCILSFYFVSCVLCDLIFYRPWVWNKDLSWWWLFCTYCLFFMFSVSCFWLKVKVSVPLPFTDCCHSSSF